MSTKFDSQLKESEIAERNAVPPEPEDTTML
jgi:hypothetical protein